MGIVYKNAYEYYELIYYKLAMLKFEYKFLHVFTLSL